MTVKSVAMDIGILLAVGGICAGIGYARGYVDGDDTGVAKGNAKVLVAEQDVQTAKANTAAVQRTLAQIEQQLAQQKQQLLDAQQHANDILDADATLKTQLAAATRQRIEDDRKAVNESPDCAALKSIAVCPELARRLWGSPAKTTGPATAPSAGH